MGAGREWGANGYDREHSASVCEVRRENARRYSRCGAGAGDWLWVLTVLLAVVVFVSVAGCVAALKEDLKLWTGRSSQAQNVWPRSLNENDPASTGNR